MAATEKKAPAKTTTHKAAPKSEAKSEHKPAAKTKSTATSKTDAIALLIKDHKDVKALFKKYDKLVEDEAGDDEKKELAETICHMLTVHTTIEEEIFYPAAREAIAKDEDMLDEAEVEHASAKELIAQIQSMQPGDDLYDAKVHVLGEYVDHHVTEEEEEMFPKIQKSDMDTAEIGQELLTRKEELEAEEA